MTEFNRHTFPKAGWVFFQPQTNWHAPTPLASTFSQTVNLIVAMRKKNPAITAQHKLSTNPEAVASELEAYTRKRLGLKLEAAPTPFPVNPSPSRESVAGAVVARVKKLAAGAALLFEWESSGAPPVAQNLAESRATICSTCPQNKKGVSLSEWFTVPAADAIRKKLARLNDMKLTTSKDAGLNVCEACLCPLHLKLWCPGDLILKHMKPETKAELDPRCWILKL